MNAAVYEYGKLLYCISYIYYKVGCIRMIVIQLVIFFNTSDSNEKRRIFPTGFQSMTFSSIATLTNDSFFCKFCFLKLAFFKKFSLQLYFLTMMCSKLITILLSPASERSRSIWLVIIREITNTFSLKTHSLSLVWLKTKGTHIVVSLVHQKLSINIVV